MEKKSNVWQEHPTGGRRYWHTISVETTEKIGVFWLIWPRFTTPYEEQFLIVDIR